MYKQTVYWKSKGFQQFLEEAVYRSSRLKKIIFWGVLEQSPCQLSKSMQEYTQLSRLILEFSSKTQVNVALLIDVTVSVCLTVFISCM